MVLLDIKQVEFLGKHNVAGWLPKGWYTINNNPQPYLVKGNTKAQLRTEFTNGYEPYSEVLATLIAQHLDLPHIPYYLAEAHHFPHIKINGIKHVSVCPSFLKEGYYTQNLADFCLARGLDDGKGIGRWGNFKNIDVYNTIKNENIDLDTLHKILLFDALVGNRDRHLGNIELYVPITKSIGKPHFVPLFDNGGSLLGVISNPTLLLAGTPNFLDKAHPFANNHREQIKLVPKELITNIVRPNLLNNLIKVIEPVKPFLPTFRYQAIVRFLTWRVGLLEDYAKGVDDK